ncbi:hypothetical protein EPZ47_10560 [Pseudomonas viciae]|uniref:Uncharacterized protein n=1 Tax=Pseudomonas viciae TaxID=2505979 RepID=A0A4P7PEU5_9PSED|nr:hypothetical protein EPZ47_10560 [Pseudomonas viciae]
MFAADIRNGAREHRFLWAQIRPPPIPVGASLLAKASAHSTSPLADPPLSRASSLPQGIPVGSR